MARHCEVCYHTQRKDIENDIIDGGLANSISEIAKRYKLKPYSVKNHKDNHMVTIVDEAKRILDEQCKEHGVNRILNSVEVLDLIISKAPHLLENTSMRDVLQALKLKHEILGDVKEEKKIKVEWLDEVKE